jgi:hypothetical protein
MAATMVRRADGSADSCADLMQKTAGRSAMSVSKREPLADMVAMRKKPSSL